ncbi:hypothetical protein ACFOWM_01645 [Ferruginibacter yonginensis]|uniref:Lipoprotein n=1 Tax=Ferruginibacter yonginensis TaxID=1310416 RepID=A0ABV8QRI9_9BACT
MKKIQWVAIMMLSFIVASCNSTQVISSYKDEKAVIKDYKKILVLGIFQQKDRALRQATEDALADKLKDKGYNAVTAMQEFGPKAFDKVPEDQIAEKLKNSGFDAVITTALLDKKKDQSYQPGNVRYQPVGVYYNRFGRYYTTVYDRVYQPGYYTTSTDYYLESNLYDINSGDMVYSVQTQSYDPSSARNLANNNSKRIVQDLVDNGILK